MDRAAEPARAPSASKDTTRDTWASAIPSLIDIDLSAERDDRLTLGEALERVAARAQALDAAPCFPTENFEDLRAAGVLQHPADRGGIGRARDDRAGMDRGGSTLREEIALVRAVAAADASTARILDGHLNGVERLAMNAPRELRESELAGVARGALLLGVWGADPAPGEGEPAQVVCDGNGSLVLRGVKTFCSGAGGVQRALVVVREGSDSEGSQSTPHVAPGAPGGRRLAYIDTSEGLTIDRGWYRASGLRASESHRVEFADTPVLALLGGENELLRQPWFARDGVRTAATWAGIADGIFAAAERAFDGREPDEHQARALGRMRVASRTIDRWLEYAGTVLEDATSLEDPATSKDPAKSEDPAKLENAVKVEYSAKLENAAILESPAALEDPAGLATECRAALIGASRAIADEAAQACGSRSLIAGDALDRGRRDLDLFLLQHRLDPQLAKLGRATLAARTDPS